VVNRYLDVDWQSGFFLRFWSQNASSNPPGAFFPAGSGFWAKTVNKRLFEKKGAFRRLKAAFLCSNIARGSVGWSRPD
jgi:hypothetical protein